MFKLFNNYDAPDSAAGGGDLDKDGILDILNSDDTKEPIKEVSKPVKEDRKDDEDEETEEDEIEIEEPGDDKEIKEPETEIDDLELVTPFKRKEILKKYPDIFKDFPYLETSYRRERQYNEIFPTIDSAKEAIEKAEALDNFEANLLKGTTVEVLEAVKKNNQQAFLKIVDDYLPNLAKVDQQAYMHVLGNVMRTAVINMKREAAASKDEDLSAAADILNKFVFGHTEVSQPTRLAKEESATNEVEKERAEFMKERFETALTDVNGQVEKALKLTIDVNLDPNKSMSDYVRRAAAKEVFESIYTELAKDSSLSRVLDNLWKEASTKKFDRASTDRIRAAFLSKAKTVLGPLVKKARAEALKGQQGNSKKEEKTIIRRAPGQDDNRGKSEKKSAIPKGMSTLDYFNTD